MIIYLIFKNRCKFYDFIPIFKNFDKCKKKNWEKLKEKTQKSRIS